MSVALYEDYVYGHLCIYLYLHMYMMLCLYSMYIWPIGMFLNRLYMDIYVPDVSKFAYDVYAVYVYDVYDCLCI